MGAWQGRKLHFVGIGGAGMSGLASVCASLGAAVKGSDRSRSVQTDRLASSGVEVVVGHDPGALDREAEVVVSTAIAEDNPELELARSRGQRILHRSELLAELCGEKRLIAVSGTHGKTTTTAMIAWALRETGCDPAFFVGGDVCFPSGPANASWGGGEWVVAEADESDGSFLAFDPDIAVITNVELDHHSRWGTLTELTDAFAGFAARAGRLAVGPDVDLGVEAQRFDSDRPGPERLSLAVPGEHNVLNARGALAALELAGFELAPACEALSTFPGVKRRLELKGERDGATVYDDYAHHPTEVAAVLQALRGLEPRRLVAVFQPHLFSRTRAMADDLGAALTAADRVLVLDVYPAREEPVGELAGVSGLDVARAAADRDPGCEVWWLGGRERALEALDGELGEGDVLVTLGAGDVTELSDLLVDGAER